MIEKNLDELSFDDIQALVDERVAESRTLEFKRDVVGSRDEDKREFLADVSAFANTIGGDIVFGIDEVGGSASKLFPLALADPDAEIRRLDSLLNSCLEPRLPRSDIKWIANSSGHGVLLVRTPRSWVAPHRVIFRDHGKFYARSSSGKYPLDVAQLRSAFDASSSLTSRVQSFRRERMNIVVADEAVIPLRTGAKVLFHILPVSAFTDPISLSLTQESALTPLGASGFNYLHTLEGFATYSGPEDSLNPVGSYALLFRNGIIEAVTQVGHETKLGPEITPSNVENPLMRAFPRYVKSLVKLGIEPPYYIALTLIDVRGCALTSHSGFRPRRSLRRDTLIFPEAFVENAEASPESILKPLFDLFWQAFGFPFSYAFDETGRYVGTAR